MPAFEYVALDNVSGKQKKGVQEADSPRQVRQSLREQKLTPVEVREVAERKSRQRQRGGGIRIADLALLMRQVATLVASSLPLEEALLAVAEQTDKVRVKNMLMAIRSKVLEGHTLADGMAEFPQVFPDMFRATTEAGEQSGRLDLVLERLADYAEIRQEIRQKTTMALLYPLILAIVAISACIFLVTYVVPQVVSAYQNGDAPLPWITETLITLSDFLRDHWLILAAIGAGTFIVLTALFRQAGPKFWLHRQILRAPLLGRLSRGLQTARFTRTLSILVASGVPVLDALRIAGEVVSNLPMRQAIADAALRVREGVSIHQALAVSKLFPPMTLHLIANGEASGKLENMLERAAVNQDREAESLRAGLLGVLEPALIVGMAFMVLGIVLAIMLPIMNMNQLLQ